MGIFCIVTDNDVWLFVQAVPLTEEIDGTSEDDDVPSEGSLIPQKVTKHSHLLYLSRMVHALTLSNAGWHAKQRLC